MNINNIGTTLKFDNIEELTKYREEWSKSNKKEIEIYSVYTYYFEPEISTCKQYFLYVGLSNNLHLFYCFNSEFKQIKNIVVKTIKLINNNLVAVNEYITEESKLLKKVKDKETLDNIYTVVLKSYKMCTASVDDVLMSGKPVSVGTLNSSTFPNNTWCFTRTSYN